jgi:hypothetical protein
MTEKSARMSSVFEIVGSFFVDVIFNHVYNSARTNVSNGSSLTDEYIRRITAYMTGVKSDKQCYGDTVHNLHRYVTGTTRYTTISFSSFVDLIVSVCIPEEYFGQFTTQDKDEILSSVLCDLVANLTAYATKHDMLRRVIDEHNQSSEVTIRMLQDFAVQSLIEKRSDLRNKFLRKKGQARENVSMDIVEDMKQALRRVVKEKSELAASLKAAEEARGELAAQVRELKKREAKLRQLVDLLRDGRARGPAAAGAALSVPARDRIAENPFDLTKEESQSYVPPRDRIAEREPPWAESRPADESDAAKKKKFGPSALPADFFASATASAAPAPAAADRPSAAADRPSAAAPPKTDRPLMPANLFDDELFEQEEPN